MPGVLRIAKLPLAGIEHGSQCFCGTDIALGLASIVDALISGLLGECRTLCFGDNSKGCGGLKALSAYINHSIKNKREEGLVNRLIDAKSETGVNAARD